MKQFIRNFSVSLTNSYFIRLFTRPIEQRSSTRMSNYFGRKREFTPAVYTRYFEQTDTPKTSQSQGHIYFDEDKQESSSTYQTKRDLMFKRLFPAKYADANNNNPNETELAPATSNGTSTARNNGTQVLGDFISLAEVNTSVPKRESALPLPVDIILSSSDDEEDDDNDASNVDYQLPAVRHASIVGNVHSRLAIENVRAVMIRELYQRTSDSHTEWLKCKMEIPKEFINPKYYADFQRRYKYEIRKNNSTHNRKSTSRKTRTEQGYHVIETKRIYQETIENDDIIEIKSTKSVSKTSSSDNVQSQSQALPDFIVLDSADDDANDNDLDYTRSTDQSNATFFVDRSSSIAHASSPSTSAPNEDYLEEDSKYSQLPSRTAPAVIRPILSKHQRRKKKNPITTTTTTESTTPLVSAIDRIIDQMDQSNPKDPSAIAEEKNLLIKTMKKRKKKKKTKSAISTID